MIYLFLIFISTLFLYISTLSNTVYGGDAGDLVSAVLAKGFSHPPGYPLYTIFGRLFLNLPTNILTPAGKVTLISTFSTIFALILTYSILHILFGKKLNKTIALITVLILSVNYLIWLYAIVPEVFPLNTFIILFILFNSLKFRRTGKNIWLCLLFFSLTIGISHHHTYILIIPSVVVLIWNQLHKLRLTISKVFFLLLSFGIGLIPLIYLPITASQHPEIIWGKANTFSGFIGLLTRQAYGTFVPGFFISNSPIHRFIQLTNIHFFILSDFTLIGYFMIIVGIIIIIRSKLLDKKEKTAVFLALFLFGPFFFFYANFPLRDKFDLATVERFMLVFYFLLAIPYYFGLQWFFSKLTQLIKHLVRKPILFITVALLLLFIMPIGLMIKNYRRLILLKKTQIAEKLGRDVLKTVQPNSIVLLSGDTLLFNTQYVFYSNKKNYKDKIVIQASKITVDYYQKSLKSNYSKLIFSKKNSYGVGDFITNNVKNFTIYSNDKYSLPSNFPYKWIVQGLLFRLVPRDYNNTLEVEKTIQIFWNTAENKNLANYYLINRNHWLNYFPNDILRIYATGHQNTAYYYLSTNQPKLAFPHIKQAIVLNPEDLDSLFLQSVYYAKTNDCAQAEKSIIQALEKNKDKLYLFQLDQLNQCYKDEANKQRIQNLIKKYSDQPLKKLINQ